MRKFLIVLLLLLAPNLVWADSAWVLWVKQEFLRDKEIRWERVTAMPTYELCFKVLFGIVKGAVEAEDSQVVYDQRTKYIGFDPIRKGFKTVEYNCFPDTIDPRK
jgi:hypothetical protein